MNKRIYSWGTALLLAISSIAPVNSLAATTNVSVGASTYTSIAGPGAVSATVTASRDILYEFSSTAPSVVVYGHRLLAGQSLPLSSMGAGIYMWVKGEVESATVVITSGTDATIGASGGSSSTVTANAGTNLNTSLLALESGGNLDFIASSVTGLNNTIGTAAVGTAANKSQLAGLIYNSSSPSLSTGQQVALQSDSSGNLKVNIAAGAASGAVAQGSTTAGQTGGLIQGATTTSAPTYTNAQTNPLSLTTAGALRTDSSATTQPVSAASLPLPSGAATSANQSTEIASLATIATNSGTQATSANQATANTALSAIQANTAAIPYLSVAGQTSVTPAAAAANCTVSTAGCNLLKTDNTPWTDVRFGVPIITIATGAGLTGSGVITFESASDSAGAGAQTVQCLSYGQTLTNGLSITLTPIASGLYRSFCPIHSGFIRARVTTLFGGTNAITSVNLLVTPMPSPYVFAQQFSAWTFQPGNTPNTTPWLNTPVPVVTPLSSSAPLNTDSAAYEASHVVKAGAGVLYGLSCYSSKATSQFILLFNSTTVPADTTASVSVPLTCPGTSNCSIDFGQYGRYFSTGISWSNSSTSPTKTIGSTDTACAARYQ